MQDVNNIKEVLTVKEIKDNVLSIAPSYPIKKIGLFGSYARGQANAESDVDLLVEMEKPVSLLKSIHIESVFSNVLRKQVELVTTSGLHRAIRPFIMNDYISLYEK